MKIFKIMMMALVAMCGLNSCSDDCNHENIEYDYSKELVGTWTCLKADFAEALVFKGDGTFASVGVANGKYWEYPNATWTLKDNKLSLNSEDYKSNVRLEIIPGNSLALVDEKGNRNVFNYCENDLADEVVGMWVCNDGLPGEENDMAIITYSEDGKMTMTAANSTFIPDDFVKQVCDYKVIGDLVFKLFPKENFTEGGNPYLVSRVDYAPNGTSLGDLLIENQHTPTENGVVDLTFSFLRIKQNLNLSGKKYDYTKTFVTNAKGEDKDIPFLDTSFNFAKMDGSIIDKFLKSILFSVEFPDANTIKYSYLLEGENIVMTAPIEVEGNKMTIKMSETIPVYQDVEIYTFQDQDNTQMHLYMPTASFEKFFANTSVAVMLGHGQLDINDAEAIAEVYKSVADALESINLTIILK